MRKLGIASVLACGLFSMSAHAGFVKVDYIEEGDNRVVLHEESGLEWLRLDETTGMSLNQVKASLNGGELEGWRLPTESEVDNMIGEWFASIPLNGGDYLRTDARTAYLSVTTDFIVTMGLTEYQDGKYNYAFSKGFFEAAEGVVISGTVRERNGGTSIAMYYVDGTDRYDYNADSVSSSTGVFLVSDGGLTLSSVNDPSINRNNPNSPYANVSTPWSAAMLAMVMTGLGLRRKRSV